MSLKAYIDDSGIGDSPVYALAGLFGPVKNWLALTDEWDAILRMSPRIPYFKAKDAFALDGVFLGISEERRNEKVRLLMRAIEEHELIGIGATITQSEFENYWKISHHKHQVLKEGEAERLISNPWRSPYFLLNWTILWRFLPELYNLGFREKIDFIFDEEVMERDKVEMAYRTMKGSSMLPPEIESLLGNPPYFLSDLDVLPLQAADLYVTLTRRVRQINLTGHTIVVPPEAPGSKLLRLDFHWNKEEMDRMIMTVGGSVPTLRIERPYLAF